MSGYEYTVSRVVDAPVEQVWRMWTEAEHYAGVFQTTPGAAEIDVRPGGAWKITMSGGTPMTGAYVEVIPNKRLVTTMDGAGPHPSPMAMDLADEGGRTRITFSQTCTTREEHAQSKEGSEILLQWCADYATKM
ncbi:SRPBCC family protein [Phytohabitans sp. LJ34]|uniref:SRPBCC family protein n=1 Tax=Phytohabitans sp. LJ34 TaxID=3452217 RepID=UPI003F890C6D